jgi:hypothetical protein
MVPDQKKCKHSSVICLSSTKHELSSREQCINIELSKALTDGHDAEGGLAEAEGNAATSNKTPT